MLERPNDERFHKGVRAIAFYARGNSAHDDPTADVTKQAMEWIIANRETACPLHVEFDQWGGEPENMPSGATASERLLATIFPKPEHPVWWQASAVVYYDDVEEEKVPRPIVWEPVEEG